MVIIRSGTARRALLLTWAVVVMALTGATGGLCHHPVTASTLAAHQHDGPHGHDRQHSDGGASDCRQPAVAAVISAPLAVPGTPDGVRTVMRAEPEPPAAAAGLRASCSPSAPGGGRSLLIGCGVART